MVWVSASVSVGLIAASGDLPVGDQAQISPYAPRSDRDTFLTSSLLMGGYMARSAENAALILLVFSVLPVACLRPRCTPPAPLAQPRATR